MSDEAMETMPDNDIMASVAQAKEAAPELLVPAVSDDVSPAEPHESASSNTAATDEPIRDSVKLHIPLEGVPSELYQGLSEIARLHIRKGAVKFCQRPGHGLMSAGGAPDPASGKGRRGEWWWNVVFEHDVSVKPGTLVLSTSSQSFAAAHAPPGTTAFVAQPWTVTVRYSRRCEAFRGLGHILGVTRAITRPTAPWTLDPEAATRALNCTQEAQFETLGTMIDVSRNGVLSLPAIKFLCRKLALCGYNHLQLYTEDTYKVEGEPFFGYLRGGYTQQELREVDDYAFALGIECVPCIQTLGHLGQVLQWPRFLALRDTTEVLLAELPETYELLDKMIVAATAPFRSKRIHLGQDEAHGLGHGRYHSVFGQHEYKEPTRIFIEHLQQVNRICLRLGLQPMIWSDMLFCLHARNNSLLGYYDSEQPEAPDVQGLPDNMDLVYWDYYHLQESNYAGRIASHRELNKGRAPWVAAGTWTWTRFWTALPFTFAACRASQNACKQSGSGVRNVFLTTWGDEGNEVDLWSSMPAWIYYADHGYTAASEVDVAMLKAKFDGICGGNFDDFVIASRLDDQSPETQTMDDRVHFAPNTSKWMLWEEPFFGFVTPTLRAAGMDMEHHYRQLADYLDSRLTDTPVSGPPDPEGAPPRSLRDHPFNARLRFPALIARALALKARLRERLSSAYAEREWGQLAALAGRGKAEGGAATVMADLRETVSQLHHYHRELWMSMNRPFGWETIDLRYGGLKARLETMHHRITRFLDHVTAGGHVGTVLSDGDGDGDDGGEHEGGPSLRRTVPEPSADGEAAPWWEPVTSLPELEVPLEVTYASADQLLDYHRVSRPTYC
ncbi:unnamed protein product [Parajaminaea phylloscopi]